MKLKSFLDSVTDKSLWLNATSKCINCINIIDTNGDIYRYRCSIDDKKLSCPNIYSCDKHERIRAKFKFNKGNSAL